MECEGEAPPLACITVKSDLPSRFVQEVRCFHRSIRCYCLEHAADCACNRVVLLRRSLIPDDSFVYRRAQLISLVRSEHLCGSFRHHIQGATASMTSFDDLPEPLQGKILQAVPEACTSQPQTLLSLACVNRWFAAQLRQPSSDAMWSTAWLAAKQKRPAAAAEEQKAGTLLPSKPRDLLRLAGFNGCMLCGAKAIRKVYWEYSIRCCKECLLKNSLAEAHLKKEFGLLPASFEHLPHRQVQMYKPHAGTFTFNAYWKPDLLPVLQQQHNVQSFEEYTQQSLAQQAEKEQHRAEQQAQRAETLQNWCQEDQVDLVEANSFSSIYQRNCHLALPLKRKAYERLLPRIRTEINTTKQQAAEKRQKVEGKLLLPVVANPPAAPKPPKHKKSKPDGSNPKMKRNLTCAVCGGHRLFSANGLSDHTKAKHP